MKNQKHILATVHSTYAWPSTRRREPYADQDERNGYAAFYERAWDFGFETVCVIEQAYKHGAYTGGWTWDGKKWKKIRQRIVPSVVMDKTRFSFDKVEKRTAMEQDTITLNNWELNVLASDKLFTGAAFSEITPTTFMVKNSRQMKRALDAMKTKRVVLKPRFGIGGKGIEMMSKKEAYTKNVSELTVVQEHVNNEKGIPGIYNGLHDFRVIMADEKPVLTFYRTAAPGTETCNISQGGTAHYVPLSKMPKAVKPLLKEINAALHVIPYKFYAADFVFRSGRTPLLIELNTKPMLVFPESMKDLEKRMHEAYLKYFASLV